MVPGKVSDRPTIGRQLFDVITSGMYDNPLMIFREYIQNSVDSIDLGIEVGKISLSSSEITIQLNGLERSIAIIDNGVGMSNSNAHHILRSLGCSPKEGTLQRGFRGIGRLGGLAYCDELVFETRSTDREMVAVVSWDRIEFEKIAAGREGVVGLVETIEKVSCESLRVAEKEEPEHFFKVTLKNVHKFHSDALMNLKLVYDYLAQVAPVSYDNECFSFGDRIEQNLSKYSKYRHYRVTINGREVKRPYSNILHLSNSSTETINDIDLFTFYGADETPIAIGWYAITNFKSALPKSLNCRGLRVRQGNIEIGNEHFLDDAFTERRFSSWQIGEIQILANRLKPNARRDGFEQSPDYERFLEQAHLLGRHLSGLCRKSSNERNVKTRINVMLQGLEKILVSPSAYFDEEHYDLTLERAAAMLRQMEKSINGSGSKELLDRYEALKVLVEERPHKPVYLEKILDGRRLRKFDNKTLLAHVARTVVNSYTKTKTADELLQKILLPFMTKPE